MSSEPADRPADAQVVAARIAAYRTGDTRREHEAAIARVQTKAAEERGAVEAEARRASSEAVAERRARRRFMIAVGLAGLFLLLLVTGSVAWWLQERARKARHTREAVTAQLQVATDLRKRYQFRASGETLEHAAKLAEGGATDELKRQVQQARDDLSLVVTLDTIRMRGTRIIVPNLASEKLDYDTASAPAEYKAAFDAAGYPVGTDADDRVAERITASAIRQELVDALDDWALHEPDPKLAERILSVARQVDPGHWLDRFRDPATRNNPEKLRKLASEVDVKAVSPATLASLMGVLRKRSHSFDLPNFESIQHLLDSARFHHPTDFLLSLAAKDYGAARALRPDNPTALIGYGPAIWNEKNLDPAILYFQEALRLDPDNVVAHYHLALSLARKEAFTEAITEFKQVVRLAPRIAAARVTLAEVLVKKGDTKEAIEVLREAVRIVPGSAESRLQLVELLLEKTGDREGAAKELDGIARMDLRDLRDLRQFTQLAEKLGKPEVAAGAYQKLIKARNADAIDLLTCIRLLLQLEQTKEVEKDIDRYWLATLRSVGDGQDFAEAWARVAGGKENEIYWEGLGFAHRALGKIFSEAKQQDEATRQFDQAIVAFERAKSLTPITELKIRNRIDRELEKTKQLKPKFPK